MIAELRGKLDADGKSPFWEGLGRHFFAMEYSTADYLTGIGQKAFVAELMPRHPVYVNLLPESARAVDRRSARRHAARARDARAGRLSLRGLRRHLRRGSRRSNAFATTSTRCAQARCCRWTSATAIRCPTASPTTSVARRAIAASRTFARCSSRRRARIDRFPLLPYAAAQLGVADGDLVRAVPLAPETDDDGDTAARRGSDVNFDGIPGPTHNYSGLARGNLAAEQHAQSGRQSARRSVAGTRQDAGARRTRLSAGGAAAARATVRSGAARAGLRRQRRRSRRARGARRAARCSPPAQSAAAMWVANAATVSPSRRHRRRPRSFHAGEPRQPFPPLARGADHDASAARDLRRRDALRGARSAARGAAVRRRGRGESHAVRARRRNARRRVLRLRTRGARRSGKRAASVYPARQTREASEAIARRHGLDPARTVFAQQNPGRDRRRRLPQRRDRRRRRRDCCSATSARSSTSRLCSRSSPPRVGPEFHAIVARASELGVADAVATYLFNSQLLPRPERRHAARRARQSAASMRPCAPISTGFSLAERADRASSLTFDLRAEHGKRRRSGVPAACAWRSPPRSARRSARACSSTTRWRRISTHGFAAIIATGSRPRTSADPALLDESRRALDELTRLLRLPSVYPFQIAP